MGRLLLTNGNRELVSKMFQIHFFATHTLLICSGLNKPNEGRIVTSLEANKLSRMLNYSMHRNFCQI